MFDLIATVLAWFYSIVPNYAVAIAMMTILIMTLLTPLTLKSTKSMLELQRIQPEMKRIQQQHRGDRQAMNEELMALYKEHKVNPLGGCLPLLIQAPIWFVMYRVFIGLTYKSAQSEPFFAPRYLDHSTQLYQDLSHSTEMKAFGLNLAEPAAKALRDGFVTALPYLILVAIVVATYFIQQRQITARNKNNPNVPESPAMAQQQMIMKIFPIFSGVFAFVVPAALAWYFLVQNLFRIGQQAYITKRFYHDHPDAIAARNGAGSGDKPAAEREAGTGRQADAGQGQDAAEGQPDPAREPEREGQAAAEQQRSATRSAQTPAAAEWRDAETAGAPAATAEEEALTEGQRGLMEWVETTGRTVDEAKGRALDQLGVDDLDAEFEIVEEPRPGLFGRVRGEARVRARVKPTAPRPKIERRDRRRKRDDQAAANPNGEATAAPARKTSAPVPPAPTPSPEETTMSDGEIDSEEVEAGATTFLTGLLDAFGIDATVTARHPADGEIEMAIEGDELGLLVGPKGQTLLAIQDLTRLAAQRRVGPGSPRLAVDVGGYRQRRVEALGRFSQQVAQQVVDSGLPKSLEPMAAADRKVVHDALTDVAGVATVSEGEEPYRRVVIVPESAS